MVLLLFGDLTSIEKVFHQLDELGSCVFMPEEVSESAPTHVVCEEEVDEGLEQVHLHFHRLFTRAITSITNGVCGVSA